MIRDVERSRHGNVVFPKTPLYFVLVLKRIMISELIEALPKPLLDLDNRQVMQSLAGKDSAGRYFVKKTDQKM
jgi:hypothetical protein